MSLTHIVLPEIKDNELLYVQALWELNSRFSEMSCVCVSQEHRNEGGIAIFCPGTPGWRVVCAHRVTSALGVHQGEKHQKSVKLCFMPPRHNRREGGEKMERGEIQRCTGGRLRSTLLKWSYWKSRPTCCPEVQSNRTGCVPRLNKRRMKIRCGSCKQRY